MGQIFFARDRAEKFFKLNDRLTDKDAFLGKQNVEDYFIWTHIEENLMRYAAYNVLGDVEDEVLSYIDEFGY